MLWVLGDPNLIEQRHWGGSIQRRYWRINSYYNAEADPPIPFGEATDEEHRCYVITGLSVKVARDPNYTGSLADCYVTFGGSEAEHINMECPAYDPESSPLYSQGIWKHISLARETETSHFEAGGGGLLFFYFYLPEGEPVFHNYPVYIVSNGSSHAIGVIYGYEVDCPTGEPTLNITTLEATDIAESEGVVTATINGEITEIGGENADERGFDYGLTDSYSYSWTEEGDFGIGSFNHELPELLPYTTYHFRAKAHNSTGWVYGEDLTFGYYPGAGYLWVEGVTLCYTAMDAGKKVLTGTNIGGSHTPGHIWVEGNNLHYIDGSGAERWIEGVLQSGSLPGNSGYIWIEETLIHFIDSSGEERYAVL